MNTKYFTFDFGDKYGGRQIDSQFFSSTQYLSTTMGGDATVFGVNFADGRIKGYPRDIGRRHGANKHFVRYVRGNTDYGKNHFVDNHDATVSDLATGLMWAKADSPRALNWQQALSYCENLKLAGHDDWRLPNAKELQSIIDYDRAPRANNPSQRGPAIDPMFTMHDPKSWAWSSTTHMEGASIAERAVYVCFGEATGNFYDRRTGKKKLMDVHGAGAQRSDPKSGDPTDPRWANGMGPQGDIIRILNYARAVRNIDPIDVKLVRPDTRALPENKTHGSEGREGRDDRDPFGRLGGNNNDRRGRDKGPFDPPPRDGRRLPPPPPRF